MRLDGGRVLGEFPTTSSSRPRTVQPEAAASAALASAALGVALSASVRSVSASSSAWRTESGSWGLW